MSEEKKIDLEITGKCDCGPIAMCLDCYNRMTGGGKAISGGLIGGSINITQLLDRVAALEAAVKNLERGLVPDVVYNKKMGL